MKYYFSGKLKGFKFLKLFICVINEFKSMKNSFLQDAVPSGGAPTAECGDTFLFKKFGRRKKSKQRERYKQR